MLPAERVLNGWGIARLRVWNPSGEPIMQRERAAEEADPRAAARRPTPLRARCDWSGPTRSCGARSARAPMAAGRCSSSSPTSSCSACSATTPWPASRRRNWAAAYGLVPVAILSLLLVSAQAVTAITSERDLGALDLLLVTDLTPQEFIFGKLGGILYNAKEYLLPPLMLADRLRRARPAGVGPAGRTEPARRSSTRLPVHRGASSCWRSRWCSACTSRCGATNSRLAIANTLGTVFFLSVGTLVCIYLILINGRFEYQWLSFSAFIFAGVGGLWWVLCGEQPSAALTLASWLCPFAVFYTVTNVLIGQPGGLESSDPPLPFLVTGGAFGFTVAAMLVPLLSEFDVAIGRTSIGGD